MSFALPTEIELPPGDPQPPAQVKKTTRAETRKATATAEKDKGKEKEKAPAPATPAGSSSSKTGGQEPTTKAPQPAPTASNPASSSNHAEPTQADPPIDAETARALQARIRQLEAALRQQQAQQQPRPAAAAPAAMQAAASTAPRVTQAAQVAAHPAAPPTQQLVADPGAIEQAAQARLLAEAARAAAPQPKALPAIVPGKKASAYQIGEYSALPSAEPFRAVPSRTEPPHLHRAAPHRIHVRRLLAYPRTARSLC